MDVTLHWSDYFILALSLFAYALVGLYFRWSSQITNTVDRCLGRPVKEVRTQTAQEIFLANRQLGVLPVMASTAASFLSAATLMGNHLEIYLYGFPVLANSVSYLVLFPIVSEIYMPVLYKLNLLSINQYFAMRFGGGVKLLATITFILQMIIVASAINAASHPPTATTITTILIIVGNSPEALPPITTSTTTASAILCSSLVSRLQIYLNEIN
nr:unnamed protein product [Spirometra erinaceieuropaei]